MRQTRFCLFFSQKNGPRILAAEQARRRRRSSTGAPSPSAVTSLLGLHTSGTSAVPTSASALTELKGCTPSQTTSDVIPLFHASESNGAEYRTDANPNSNTSAAMTPPTQLSLNHVEAFDNESENADGTIEGDVGGWLISRALRVLYPPSPTIAERRCGYASGSPFSFYGTRSSALVVPESTSRLYAFPPPGGSDPAVACSAASPVVKPSEEKQSCGREGEQSVSLLRCMATLPCGVGVRCSVTASEAAPSPASLTSTCKVEREGRSDSAFSLVNRTQVRPPLQNRSVDTAADSQNTQWAATGAAHDGAQVCAEASAFALRTFAADQLRQNAPTLFFVAETPYRHDDAVRADDGHDRRPFDDALATPYHQHMGAGSPPLSLPSTTAMTNVPVETYVERTPLTRTDGTAALQRRVQRALATAAWLRDTTSRNYKSLTAVNTQNIKKEFGAAGDRRHNGSLSVSSTHLLWNGKDWMLERDAQLIQAEEVLLTTLCAARKEDNRTTCNPSVVLPTQIFPLATGGDFSTMVRAWLPSEWTTPLRALMTPPIQIASAGDDGLIGKSRSPCSRTEGRLLAETSSQRNRNSGVPSLSERWAPSESTTAVPTATTTCHSWMIRLHKTWLVSGARQAHALHNSLAGDAAPGPLLWRQPSYNLLTGAPLDLTWYMARVRRRSDVAEQMAPQTQKEDVANDRSSTFLQRMGDRLALLAKTPFQCAAQSDRCGWVRLTRTMRAETAHPCTTQEVCAAQTLQWALPPELQLFSLPRRLDQVRARQLTDQSPLLPSSSPSSGGADHLPCLAGVSVPKREWFTGFFAHDSPSWWQGAVTAALADREAKLGPLEVDHLPAARAEVNYRCEGHGGSPCHAAALYNAACNTLSAEVNDGSEMQRTAELWRRNGLLLLCRLMSLHLLPDLPPRAQWRPADVTAGAMLRPGTEAPALPTVYVLRLQPAPPHVEHDEISLRLFWSFLDERDIVTSATVNFAFSLHDVLHIQANAEKEAAASAATDTRAEAVRGAPSMLYDAVRGTPLLVFVEVKAALEVLRRVDALVELDSSGQPSSTQWWRWLDAFYHNNAVQLLAERGEAQRIPPCEPADQTCDKTVGEDVEHFDETPQAKRTKPTSAVTALCHPTAAEITRALLSTISSTAVFNPNARIAGCVEENIAEHAQGEGTGSDMITRWSRAAYHELWKGPLAARAGAAAATAAASSSVAPSPTLDGAATFASEDSDDDDDDDDDEDNPLEQSTEEDGVHAAEQTETAITEHRNATAATTALTTAEVEKNEDALSPGTLLPYGVEVYTYDDDGTRILSPTPSESRSTTRVLAEHHASADHHHHAQQNDGQTQPACRFSETFAQDGDWPAVDRRNFRYPGHRLEDALQPPAPPRRRSYRRGSATVAAAQHLSEQQKRAGSWLRIPHAAPITVAALGVDRAASIVAARDRHKSFGYVPAFNRRINGLETSPTEQSCVEIHEADAPAVHSKVTSQKDRVYDQDSCAAFHSFPRPQEESAARSVGYRRATTTTDLIHKLATTEEQLFHQSWGLWLKFLPPDGGREPDKLHDDHSYRHGGSRDAHRMTTQAAPLVSARPPTDPRRRFPFLRPSRLTERHIDSSHKHTESAPPHHLHKDTTIPTNAAVETQEPSHVVAHDLGLAVLQVEWEEMYVNTANLLNTAA